MPWYNSGLAYIDIDSIIPYNMGPVLLLNLHFGGVFLGGQGGSKLKGSRTFSA
jgi:hypothetical protein